MERSKPGQGLMKRIAVQEEKHKAILVDLERRKQAARDKVTGKSKAKGYVQKWLEALTTAELREEAEVRGYRWEAFESIEKAVNVILAAMFEEMSAEEQAFLLEDALEESGDEREMDDLDDDEEGVG